MKHSASGFFPLVLCCEKFDALHGLSLIHILVQDQGDKYLVVNKPEVILNREELDAVYDLPFTKEYHPIYEPMGGIPARCV